MIKLNEIIYPTPIDKSEYKIQIDELQERARVLSHYANKKRKGIILVFEGSDAAGKGGSIRRLTSTLDPRLYSVVSIAAPSTEERNHHYLWRFWAHIPPKGNLTIFDRSWYGRVLVERVEGFAKEEEWSRAYSEISSFESSIVHDNYSIIKFWLHISPEEQLIRFNARKDDPMKRWKLTDEDWRNREKLAHYETACEEMLARTNHDFAPWVIIPANDKYYARIAILKTFCETLEVDLDLPTKFK
ncbi:MAG: UDP-galactose-lipid carrier transferase [Leptospiraceae bacterium]|nr:UDP-galactose-lipid carrier transferase [Leptospiraceae bacterium]